MVNYAFQSVNSSLYRFRIFLCYNKFSVIKSKVDMYVSVCVHIYVCVCV